MIRSLPWAMLMAAVTATATLAPAGQAHAQRVDEPLTECVQIWVSHSYSYQRCYEYYIDEHGNRQVTFIYHIGPDGQKYVPNE
ncbi:hypothetical protein [Stenotrophomonas sp. 24(2023)]|uniref:hypothetical protein n=1 Tax=Stenotrophomonas sp. 24(2023) TaxID=3068324 RepID=UPI0027E15D12|nr:hypothetical protein [Stenotrophomonas sp. 24(2023)]WMJ68810.1 hypothetical protein Q9R17_16735 [Stenotrophomonas sp. 24(2023)]